MLIKPIAFMQGPIITSAPGVEQFIYLGGYEFYQWNGTRLGLTSAGGIAKISLTGTLDTTFTTNANPSGQTQVRFFTPLNGNIYVDARPNILRKINGTTGAILATQTVGNSIWSMRAREGNTFFIAAGDRNYTIGGVQTFGLAKINESLVLDTTFRTNLGTAGSGGSPSGFIQQGFTSDTRIGVSGRFTSWNGNSSYDKFVVLNYDGTRDTGFNRTGAFSANNVECSFWIDNKWIVGGAFTTYGGVTQNRLMAFNSDGSVNTTFTTNLGTGFNGTITTIERVSDTQIVVGGSFTTLNGLSRERIALVNTDGTIPTNIFGTGVNGGPFIGIDNAGKYYLAGSPKMTTYNTTFISNNFFPLNSDGSVNNTFVTGSAMRTATNTNAEAGALFVR